jgi:hypothetical protein
MKLTFNNGTAWVSHGALCKLVIEVPGVSHFSQLQVEVCSAGVKNPSGELGFGTLPRVIQPSVYEVDLDTNHLKRGFHEIALVRFHTPRAANNQSEAVDFTRDQFGRSIFFVGCVFDQPLTNEQVLLECQKREAALEAEFTSGVRISDDPRSIPYACFVFVRFLLLGRRTRFDQFEVFPYERGLDSKDHRTLVNEFLARRTTTGLKFEYTDSDQQLSRHDNPVAIVHFPNVIALSEAEVAEFCETRVDHLLSLMALTRDSKGAAFEIVACPLVPGRNAALFPVRQPYRGNVAKGQISGEHAEALEQYMHALDANPFENFLLQLYKEAIAEGSDDFRCLRLWQILELVADRNNYDSSLDLQDEDGKVIRRQNGEAVKLRGGAATVYAVLRDHGINLPEAWRNANTWFGFRSAVAHYGAIANYPQLERPEVRAWVEQGIARNIRDGYNVVVSELQSQANLLLRRLLTQA